MITFLSMELGLLNDTRDSGRQDHGVEHYGLVETKHHVDGESTEFFSFINVIT